MDKKFGVIADDLTGAMDTGVQLLKEGISVRVALDNKNIDKIIQGIDVLIVDTESRNIDSRLAYARVKEAIGFLSRQGIELIYKKIDSTLRGNIGKELDAIMDSTDKKIIIVAPALPFNGRTTIDGYHYVNGVKLEDTELANDPFSPIPYSYIPDIISLQSAQKVGIIDLKTVREGREVLTEKIISAHLQGYTIVIMDSVKNEDLKIIAGTATDLKIPALLCGSAGLSQYLSQLLESKGVNKGLIQQNQRKDSKSNGSKPLVVLSGSPAINSKQQIEFAVKYSDSIGLVKLNNSALFESKSSRQKELQRVYTEVEKILASGMDLIIDGAEASKGRLFQYYKDDLKILRGDSDMLLDILSDILNRIINKVEIGGLILFGGDTAFRICSNLGSYGIHILSEVEPYVPAGVLLGGKLDGLPIITKAGGFGSESVLISARKFLR